MISSDSYFESGYDDSYGAPEPEIDIEHEISGADSTSEKRLQAFDSLTGKAHNVYELFFSFIKKLGRMIPVSRAVLVVKSPRDGRLKVIALKGTRASREGLALSIPQSDSLLDRIFESRATYTAHDPFGFSGNFIERRILLDESTASLMISPLSANGDIFGLIGLASPEEYAFADHREEFLGRVIQKLAPSVGELIKTLNI